MKEIRADKEMQNSRNNKLRISPQRNFFVPLIRFVVSRLKMRENVKTYNEIASVVNVPLYL